MKQLSLILLGLTTFLSVASAYESRIDSAAVEGLTKVEWEDVDTLYMREGASVSGFKTVLIHTPTVSFRDQWLRQQNRMHPSPQERVRPEDVEKIEEEIATDLIERFSRELVQAGFTVTDTVAEGVLELSPAIVDLDVFAPNLSYRQSGRRVSRSSMQVNTAELANEMILQLRMVDGGSGALIGVAEDRLQSRRVTSNIGNDITDRAATAVTMDRWAAKLVKALGQPES